MARLSKALKFPGLLWNRLAFEWRKWRHGWAYTEKPMWGKPLWKEEFRYDPAKPGTDKTVYILFKREHD